MRDMEFFTGAALLLIGIWIARRSNRYQEQREKEILHTQLQNQKTIELARLRLELAALRLEKRVLKMRPADAVPSTEDVNVLVAEDALKREERAKCALTGVLKKYGCDQQQIDAVLQAIDSPEEP